MKLKIYSQIADNSAPILEEYHADLHRRDLESILEMEEGTPFIHVTRKNGTHILLKDSVERLTDTYLYWLHQNGAKVVQEFDGTEIIIRSVDWLLKLLYANQKIPNNQPTTINK